MLLGFLVAGAAILADVPDPPSAPAAPTAAILKAYEGEKGRVGKGADDQVRLALWCEVNGLQAERAKHLTLAVFRDPSNAMARGLLGMVDYQGRWQRPDAVSEKVKADTDRAAAVAGYVAKRARTPDTADDQWALAVWCEQNGLKAESTAHFLAVVRLDPSREAAWKRLGYKKHDGHWVSVAQLAAARHDANLQKHADRQWKAALEHYRNGLTSSSKDRRAKAEAALPGVTDPRAVPAVWSVFAAPKDATLQGVAVQLLGQIDAAGASRALAILAVSGQSAEVRRSAAETLKRRDVREFADLLISLIKEPIRYEVKNVGGQDRPGTLSVHGKEADVKRIYTPAQVQFPQILPTDGVGFDASGLPVVYRRVAGPTLLSPYLFKSPQGPTPEFARSFPELVGRLGGGPNGEAAARAAMSAPVPIVPGRYRITEVDTVQIPVGLLMAEAERANTAARSKLENDVEEIEGYNRAVAAVNDQVLPVLAGVAGRDFGPDVKSWTRWWNDQRGVAFIPLKTQDTTSIVEQVPIDFQPAPVVPQVVAQNFTFQRMHSCFAAGTTVKTLTGPRPIETLEVGDLVLTQDVNSGAVRYQPVVTVYHNPPSATLRISLGGEAIVSSAFHRFWVPGRGWVLARDLKPGDRLRTLGGLAVVSSVRDDREQPVYNLDVAEDADYFVGNSGTLAHDMSLPDLRQSPFDAAVAAVAKP